MSEKQIVKDKKQRRADKSQRMDSLANKLNCKEADEVMSRCIADLKRIEAKKGKQ